tara:strand:- start:152 stop:1708 length:1557 start_codon:yes stop_codon:yes gene_type:complete
MTFEIADIEFDDEETWQLICEGKTKGVFQLESSLGKTWAKKVKPKNIEELSDLVAIIRPGCLKAIVDGKSMTQHYVDRKHGESEIFYLHDSLEPILKKTQGVLVYQEQSMQIAQQLAGFNLQEADDLRKAIGKKKADLMNKIKKRFIKGAKKQGIVSKEVAEEIFSWIEKSSRYAFNKSHSVSYAICAYWSAYCKAHHPVEFYCKYIQFSGGKPDPQQEVRELVTDAKSNEIHVNPPSLSKLNLTTDIIDGAIHFGLLEVKQIGDKQINKLKEELPPIEEFLGKKIDEWSWYEFLVAFSSKVYSTFVNAIISVGVLSGKGESRSKMLYEFDTWQKLTDKEKEWCINNYSKYGNLLDLLRGAQPTRKQGGGTHNVKRSGILCDLIQQLENPCYSLDDDPEWVIREEENYLGVPITYSRVDSSDTSRANATCKDIINGRGGKVKLGVTVNTVRKYITKKGDEMAFLSVEDSTGSIDNITIFHDQWSEYKNILYENNNVLIIGKKEDAKKDGIIVEKVLEI